MKILAILSLILLTGCTGPFIQVGSPYQPFVVLENPQVQVGAPDKPMVDLSHNQFGPNQVGSPYDPFVNFDHNQVGPFQVGPNDVTGKLLAPYHGH